MTAPVIMHNKKVFLIRNVAPDKYGGGEVYQLELAKELKKHGFTPAIITNSKELLKRARSTDIDTFIPPYIKTQNWSGLKNFLLPVYWLKIQAQKHWYTKLFQTEEPTIINIQSRDDWLSATMAAKSLKIRTIWTDHADFRNWVLWNVDKKLKNAIGKRIVSLMSAPEKIILISDHEKQWLKHSLINPPHNITIIHNGVHDEQKKYKEIKNKKNSFVYVGRITKEKGISELVDAFAIVNDKYPEITLNLYGEGSDLDYYKKETANNNRITFHGYTSEPLRAIAENEFFILPSYNEGLSLSLLEAAMMQKTIIATDVGATSELIENTKTGFLVQPHSTEMLAETMLKSLRDKKQTAIMAKNARSRFEQEYDLKKIFEEKMLPLYNSTE